MVPTTEPDDEVDERGRPPMPPPEKMDDAESEGDAVLLLWLKLPPCSNDTSCSRLLPLPLVCEGW